MKREPKAVVTEEPVTINLDLPYPPSANNYWRANRGIIHLTGEAKKFKRDVALIAGSEMRTSVPINGAITVTIHVYRPIKNGDLDNTLKVLLDSLRKIVYEDDRQIIAIHAFRHDDAVRPRAEIKIEGIRIATQKPLTGLAL